MCRPKILKQCVCQSKRPPPKGANWPQLDLRRQIYFNNKEFGNASITSRGIQSVTGSWFLTV
ncbi:hypothetical protein BN1708_008132 [Verticillium longisporum]|uniref:Uncharacterized protein n=1 Tax=Verticillium longisporum TaxID=100787 RepID=A0A0G4N0Q1_VERLO|nr:hypothetical protein BN1708_008132 [Verticillium longisporum]